jgi:hypothetical protein
MAAVGLGCFSLISALLGRDWRPLAMLGVAGLFALLFAAPKLVPIARFVANPALVDIRYFPLAPIACQPKCCSMCLPMRTSIRASDSTASSMDALKRQLSRAARPADHRRRVRMDRDRSPAAGVE